MTPTSVAQVSRRKRRAPLEAVRLKTPNPHTRSSRLQDLPLFVKKKTSSSGCTPCSSGYAASPDPTLSSTAAAASDSCTSTTLSIDGRFHQGGAFLDGFYAHLKSRAGGHRGDKASKQILRYVGKYLHFLNKETVDESALLDTTHVQAYLGAVQKCGIGSSGILHRILAHKAAIHFMRMTVSPFGSVQITPFMHVFWSKDGR